MMSRPHIGLNLLYLVPGETGGMEVYARELIPALRAVDPEIRLTAFVNREAAESPVAAPWTEIPNVVVPIRARRRTEWARGEQQHLPRLARRAGVDLLHSLANTAPGWGPRPRVVTVHDLIAWRRPEAHLGVLSRGVRLLVRLAVARSQRVIAVSESTRRDLVEVLGVDPVRIDVVPNGVTLPATAGDAAAARARLGAGDRPIVLSASAKRPHKNLGRLLEAIERMDERPLLVLPGYSTPYEDDLREQARALGVEDDVRFLGWTEAGELEDLYAAAACYAFPSYYEGFGLPVLEAMARGVPVVASDRSSLPEVAGGAAILFDPDDAGAVARALQEVLADGARADELRRLGHAQVERFSWEAAARGTLASYERALGR